MATHARLVSALVTEGLVEATYTNGQCVLTTLPTIPPIPLVHPPILHRGSSQIALLDPFDLAPTALSAVPLFEAYASSVGIPPSSISAELASSEEYMARALADPPPVPSAMSSSIEMEQSVVYGHPSHPMHKTRAPLPPLRLDPAYDLFHPLLRLIAVPSSSVRISGPYLSLIEEVLALYPPFTREPEYVAVPVHDLQIAMIVAHFPAAHVYPPRVSVPALAQQSLRSVLVGNTSLKLPLGIKLTSAVRTISPASAHFGVRFCSDTLPTLTLPPTLSVLTELASVSSTHPDPLIARHLACIIRTPPPPSSIPCTALVDRPSAFPSSLFPSPSPSFSPHAWFTSYASLLLHTFLPPLLLHSLAFEAHPQNTLLHLHPSTGLPSAFSIRDFGGIKLPHALCPWADPAHSIFSDDVWTRMYHSLVHNHLQQLARVMGLHYSGEAYAILRTLLKDLIPPDHPWLTSPVLQAKCFMRMRIQEREARWHLHAPFPNLILLGSTQNDFVIG